MTEVSGRGRQKGIPLKWGAKEYRLEFVPKLKIELVVMDEDVSAVVNAIVKGARTGEIGDGKIFIIPIEDAVRVRTGGFRHQCSLIKQQIEFQFNFRGGVSSIRR